MTITVSGLIDALNKSSKKKVGEVGPVIEDPERLPSGVFALDLALGGGIPIGRVTVLYGLESCMKSSISLKLIAQHQKKFPEKTCVYVDIEGHYSGVWASKLGVDTEKLAYILPDNAEQVVDLVEGLLVADDIGLVVLDSLAAMVSQRELNAEAETAQVGTTGLLINKLYRKISHSLNEANRAGLNPTLILINQVRYKVGVMYGDPECLHADTQIPFVDGSSKTIREIVDGKIFGDVWGYDPITDEFSPQPIISHHINGQASKDDFLTLTTEGVDTSNGVFSLTASYTHKIFTKRGWVQMNDLTLDDVVYSPYEATDNLLVRAFLDGIFVGDSTLTSANKGRKAGFRLQDSKDPEYLNWKKALLEPHFKVSFKSEILRLAERTEFLERYGGLNRDPYYVFAEFHPLSVAVWIMDDGYYQRGRYTLSVGRAKHSLELRESITQGFANRGYLGTWSKSGKNFVFNTESSSRLATLIAPYVPPCMHRKLPEQLRGSGLLDLGLPKIRIGTALAKVISLRTASRRKYRQLGLYDIHVGGPNTYLAGNCSNGFVVHNTMPGGPSVKFLSSMTIRLHGKDEIVKDINPKLPAYKAISVVVKKNKVPIIAKNAEFMIALMPIPEFQLEVGGSSDWATVLSYIKKLAMFQKENAEWVLSGLGSIKRVYKTQDDLKSEYHANPKLASSIKEAIIGRVLTSGDLLESE